MGLCFMKKFDAFKKSLEILLRAEREKSDADEFYRMGVVVRFNFTFELAWKSVKEVLELHEINDFKIGSPREVLKTAYQFNFLSDEKVWLDMLKSRNTIAHMYDENAAIELANAIFDNYMAAFVNLRESLSEKIAAEI